ncbi:MAG: Lrp/AsnC family transcriptional regulator [Oscillospiraceae bacterium]|nr:Lrp/AsnC family transcriptional regulator [Oscillospiraceae bacterium]
MHIDSLDAIDNQIINLLLDDARMGYSEIGEKVGLSRTAVKTRIASMERQGIIKGYKAIIDPQAAPETMIFITTIETDPNAFDGVASTLKNEKCVVTLCQISGDSAMHAVCMADSVEEMRAFAKRIRNTCPGLKKFHACNVWETMKGSVLSE